MRQALTLRVEMHDKADAAPKVAVWHILPEHVKSNVVGAAARCECMVKTFLTKEGDDVPSNRTPYFDYDAVKALHDVEYTGVPHYEKGLDA